MLKGLIVSCQAIKGEALYGYRLMGIMAKAAVEGGATAIRTSGVEDIEDVRKAVSVPIIGLIKQCYTDSEIYITPTLKEVKALCESSCDVIALDMTARKRPNGEKIEELIKYIKDNYPNKKILADVSTAEEGFTAEQLGADYVSTTLCGYTPYTKGKVIPNRDLVLALKEKLNIPLIVEGGIWEVGQLDEMLSLGVDCVVIGTAITRPREITARFNNVFDKRKKELKII